MKDMFTSSGVPRKMVCSAILMNWHSWDDEFWIRATESCAVPKASLTWDTAQEGHNHEKQHQVRTVCIRRVLKELGNWVYFQSKGGLAALAVRVMISQGCVFEYWKENGQKSSVTEAMDTIEPKRAIEVGNCWRRSPQLVLHHMLELQSVRLGSKDSRTNLTYIIQLSSLTCLSVLAWGIETTRSEDMRSVMWWVCWVEKSAKVEGVRLTWSGVL